MLFQKLHVMICRIQIFETILKEIRLPQNTKIVLFDQLISDNSIINTFSKIYKYCARNGNALLSRFWEFKTCQVNICFVAWIFAEFLEKSYISVFIHSLYGVFFREKTIFRCNNCKIFS